MRHPQKPPVIPKLVVGKESSQAASGYNESNGVINGKYLHWDQLRRRTPPAGLSHEEWWLRVRTARWHASRAVPLIGTDGNAFRYVLTDSILERVHRVDQFVSGHIGVPDPITNPQTRDQYYVSSLMEEAITSSQLEGASTTRREAVAMIRTGRAARNRSEQMILNNYATMRRLEKIQSKELTPQLVLDIHRWITHDTMDVERAAGKLRGENDNDIVVRDENGLILHRPPHSSELAERLVRMCAFANGTTPKRFVHPVMRSIVLHFWLAYDHPFVDGNGRTARALFYWSMLRQGYWLFSYVTISKLLLAAPSKYARSFLYTETDDNDLTYFADYQLDVIVRAIDELQKYIDRKTGTIRKLEAELKGLRSLNHRQRTLISHALRHPYDVYTIQSHCESHKVSRATSSSDLRDLCDQGLLNEYKIGKLFEYRPAENLESKLSADN